MLISAALVSGTLFQIARALPPSTPATVGPLSASHAVIPLGTRTEVLFACPITGATPTPGSVLLQRVDALGSPVETLGVMNDAGTGGDAAAEDRTFSLLLPLTVQQDSDLRVAVTARFSRSRIGRFSAPVTLAATRPRVQIGPAGGRVGIVDPQSSAYGAILTIPPGALDHEVEISMTAPAAGADDEGGPKLVTLEPTGLQLTVPATLHVTLPGDGFPTAALYSPSNPEANLGSEISRWQPLAPSVVGDGVIEVSVPHFSYVAIETTEPVYTVMHLPGKYLNEGDLIYTLTENLTGAHSWFPGHAALYLGTSVATADVSQNDGETIIESTPEGPLSSWGVQVYKRLTWASGSDKPFQSRSDHLYMGARRHQDGATASEREAIASYALDQTGHCYFPIGAGNREDLEDGCFSCVGLNEAAYDHVKETVGTDKSLVEEISETPFLLVSKQFNRTVPVDEITVEEGTPIEPFKVAGVVGDLIGNYTERRPDEVSGLKLGMTWENGQFWWPSPQLGTYLVRFTTNYEYRGRTYSASQALTINVGEPRLITLMLPGNIPLEMLRIPGGTFTMGSPESERGRRPEEGPQHQVTITRAFYLGRTEVTKAQWKAVMGADPSAFAGCVGDCPVQYVSWNDICGGKTGADCSAASFIGRLNQLQALKTLRLPSEAEWEYAARAATTTRFSYGDAFDCSDWCYDCATAAHYMWWCGNSTSGGDWGDNVVGLKSPNPWGFADMHGNLSEVVADWYAPYSSEAQIDPQGPESGYYRVLRDGNWQGDLRSCRSASRSPYGPDQRSAHVGFRLARSQ